MSCATVVVFCSLGYRLLASKKARIRFIFISTNQMPPVTAADSLQCFVYGRSTIACYLKNDYTKHMKYFDIVNNASKLRAKLQLSENRNYKLS